MDLADRVYELLRPDAFSHPAGDLRLLETHISWVILAGDFAYKLRKPVTFAFLDFSTLERRRADCEAEVALNRRLCEDLYLGVVDVVERQDGHLYVGGPGTPVETAVRMRRLPEAGMLPNLLEHGEGDERLLRRVAHKLAEFHASAATGPGVDEFARIDTLRANWADSFSETTILEVEKRDAIRTYVEQFLTHNAALLERRVQTGRIRDGHGDLHAGSVCSTRRRIYLFDCIEFNTRLRCADVAAEVAFLAMDLEHLSRVDLSFAFVDAYVRRSGDLDLWLLLDFYKCHRAFVRAKMLALRLAEPDLGSAESARLESDARAYFDLAYAYANGFPRPFLIITMGLPASGKTTLARRLASRLGLVHLSSDVARKQMAGLRATIHTTDAYAGGIYTRGMTRRTYVVLRKNAARWLRRGRSVVLDATYAQPSERAALRQLARRTGARLYVIVCGAEESVLKARLSARLSDPLSTSDARPEIWPALRSAFVEPTKTPIAFYADTSQSVDVLVQQIVSGIYATQAQLSSEYAA